MRTGFIEFVKDEKEFLDAVDRTKRLHYEVKTDYYYFMGVIDFMISKIIISGISKDGHIVRFIKENKPVKWSSDEVNQFMKENSINNYNEAMKKLAREKENELIKIAEIMGATPGSYEVREYPLFG